MNVTYEDNFILATRVALKKWINLTLNKSASLCSSNPIMNGPEKKNSGSTVCLREYTVESYFFKYCTVIESYFIY